MWMHNYCIDSSGIIVLFRVNPGRVAAASSLAMQAG